MGLFDHVNCECYLPDLPYPELKQGYFQTKSIGDPYMGYFTITEEGRLIEHRFVYESVPEEDRPYWGKPDWDKQPLFRIFGSLKMIPTEDVDLNYHGDINFYTIAKNKEWVEYKARFTHGILETVERVYRPSDDFSDL